MNDNEIVQLSISGKLTFTAEINLQQAGMIITFLGTSNHQNPIIKTFQNNENFPSNSNSINATSTDQQILKGEFKTQGRKLKKSKKRVISKPQPSERLSSINEFESIIPDYPSYNRLKTVGDKFLWVLLFGKNNGLSSLSSNEIVYLSDKLGDMIISKNIAAYFKLNKKKDYVNKDMVNNVRITTLGEDHLKNLLYTNVKS
jgi:hypothetical protein